MVVNDIPDGCYNITQIGENYETWLDPATGRKHRGARVAYHDGVARRTIEVWDEHYSEEITDGDQAKAT